MAYWDDLPQADIAALYGVSVAAISTRLHRARQELRARLADGGAPSKKSRTETKVRMGHAQR